MRIMVIGHKFFVREGQKKLPKIHFRAINVSFFQINAILRVGWGLTKSRKFQIFVNT